MKDFRAVKTELACYAVIIFAAFLMGFAIKNLYDPVNLVTGVLLLSVLYLPRRPTISATSEEIGAIALVAESPMRYATVVKAGLKPIA